MTIDDVMTLEGKTLDRAVAEEMFGVKRLDETKVRATAELVWQEQPSCRYFWDGFEAWRDDAGNFQWEQKYSRYSADVLRCQAVVQQVRTWMFSQRQQFMENLRRVMNRRIFLGIMPGEEFLLAKPVDICRAAVLTLREEQG